MPGLGLDSIRGRLLSWYSVVGRPLPWRRTRDPYRILVAEIMLQQTQVERVVPKYHEFLDRFPSIGALAEASLADVLRAWSPLGYNRRARNLHLIARAAERTSGQLPSEAAALRALPGVGRYTASAIGCFAFGQPLPVVDTNVRRVLSRLLFGVDPPVSEAQAWNAAAAVLPSEEAYSWNQALMDLGALICLAQRPECATCPVSANCAWRSRSPDPPRRSTAVRERGEAYRVSSGRAARRRRLRGRIVQALREAPPNAWVDRPKLQEILLLDERPNSAPDLDEIVEGLVRDGLVQRRTTTSNWEVALPD